MTPDRIASSPRRQPKITPASLRSWNWPRFRPVTRFASPGRVCATSTFPSTRFIALTRFCRWLLPGGDRLPLHELILAQELIANVLERAGLESRSCECYAVLKREYDRLFPGSLWNFSAKAG